MRLEIDGIVAAPHAPFGPGDAVAPGVIPEQAALPDGMRLIVHVGHNSLPEARRLASHAQEAGADAIAAFSPCYFRPPRLEELIGFCGEVRKLYASIRSLDVFARPLREPAG